MCKDVSLGDDLVPGDSRMAVSEGLGNRVCRLADDFQAPFGGVAEVVVRQVVGEAFSCHGPLNQPGVFQHVPESGRIPPIRPHGLLRGYSGCYAA